MTTEQLDGGEDSVTSDASVEEKRDRLDRQLADELSADPKIGELSARADSLTAARELAVERPDLIGDLVPEIAQTVLAVTPSPRSKGRSMLLGRFEAAVRRDGAAALAEAMSRSNTGESDEHVAVALRAASSVLEHATAPAATRQALRTVGAIAATRPDAVANHLDWAVSGADSESLCTTLETLLSRTSEREQLRELLRTIAILAVHDSTRPLIDGLPSSALPPADYADGIGERAYRVQAWAYVCRHELGYDSPVDPGQLWADLEQGIGVSSADPGPGIVWWLLAESAAADLPTDIDTRFATIVQHDHARTRLGDAVALPDAIVDTRRLVYTAATALDDADIERRTESARALVSLVGTPPMSTPLLELVIDTLTDAIGDPDLSPSGVVQELATLADSPSVSTSLRRRALVGLTTGLIVDHDGTKWLTAQELAEIDTPVIDQSHRMRAVETLEQVLCRDPGSLTSPLLVEQAAKQLASIACDEAFQDGTRERAADALLAALTYDEHSDSEHIQGWATDQLMELVGTDILSADQHGQIYDSLVKMLNGFQPELGEKGARGLGILAGTAAVREPLRHRAVETLAAALESTTENPLEQISGPAKVSAAFVLTRLTETDLVTPDVLERARSYLADYTLRSDTAVDGLGELVAGNSVPTPLKERAFADLVTKLESLADHTTLRDPRRTAARRLATANSYETVSEETVLSVVTVLGSVLDDSAGRAPAARGVRNVCETSPDLASRLGRDHIEQFGAELSPDTPTPTRNLLWALKVLAEESPALLCHVRDDLQGLLVEEAPVSVQTQALEVHSWLQQTGEHETDGA